MAKKPKKPLTAAQRAAKKRRKKEFMTIFINGKQKLVRRPVDEDYSGITDPIFLHQNELWHLMPAEEDHATPLADDEDMPF